MDESIIAYKTCHPGADGRGLVTPVLAAAVSNEGALGSLASGYLSPDMLEKQIIEMQQLTDRVFQVNVFVPESRKEPDEDIVQTWKNKIPFSEQAPSFSSEKEEWDDFHKKVNIILKHNVKACSFTFGIPPDESIQALKKNGCCLIGTATTPQEAVLLEERGMDIIVLQGSEAGGHRGSFSAGQRRIDTWPHVAHSPSGRRRFRSSDCGRRNCRPARCPGRSLSRSPRRTDRDAVSHVWGIRSI